MSKIEWTGATWNPIAGCSVVSPGCTNCYAMRQAHRLASNPASPHYAGTTAMSRGGPVWTGKIGIAGDSAFLAPIRRKKPQTYFVNSMSDLFHEEVPDEVIDRVFAVMALCPQHTFQILTKRADRMRWHLRKLTADGPAARLADVAGRYLGEEADCRVANFINGWSRPKGCDDGNPADGTKQRWPLPNVWLGVSTEDQRRADGRIPELLATPAAVRFVSAEPLLGPLDLTRIRYGSSGTRRLDALNARGIRSGTAWEGENLPDEAPRVALDWVIVGGESGPGARPMHPDWVRSLRDQCQTSVTAFFFKQWGEWAPQESDPDSEWDWAGADERGALNIWGHAGASMRVGKRVAGRTIDGRAFNELPIKEG